MQMAFHSNILLGLAAIPLVDEVKGLGVVLVLDGAWYGHRVSLAYIVDFTPLVNAAFDDGWWMEIG